MRMLGDVWFALQDPLRSSEMDPFRLLGAGPQNAHPVYEEMGAYYLRKMAYTFFCISRYV